MTDFQRGDGSYIIPDKRHVLYRAGPAVSGSGLSSSFGHYFADQNGLPISGAVDYYNVKNTTPSEIEYTETDIPWNATSIGFFVIPNGAAMNYIPSGSPVEFAMIDQEYHVTLMGKKLRGKGGSVFFSNRELNAGGMNYLRASDGLLFWEDTTSGGFGDTFDDIIIECTLYNILARMQLDPGDTMYQSITSDLLDYVRID